MAFYLALVIQMLVGIGLLVVSPNLFGFNHSGGGMLRAWVASLNLFIFPIILLIANIRHFRFSMGLNVAWEMWLLLASAWVLCRIPSAYPMVNLYGILLLVLILITASSVLVRASQEIIGSWTAKKP